MWTSIINLVFYTISEFIPTFFILRIHQQNFALNSNLTKATDELDSVLVDKTTYLNGELSYVMDQKSIESKLSPGSTSINSDQIDLLL